MIDKEVFDRLDSILDKLDTMKETMFKIWKAEDEEEGEYRWPYDKAGNVMDNVSTTLTD